MTQPDAQPWLRLSPWMMLVKPIESLPSLIPAIIALVFAARTSPLIGLFVAAVVLPLIAVVPWLTTRYQVTAERVTVRSGVLTRKTASAPRDRIRSVELSATLPHRILKLSRVRIGTGGDAASTDVLLNAITTTAATALREELISTRPLLANSQPLSPGQHATLPPEPTAAPVELIRFRLSWLRFAPFSLAGLAAAGAIVAVGGQVVNTLDLGERGAEAATGLADRFTAAPVVFVLVVLAVVVVISIVLSLLGYLLSYWNFSVTRAMTSSGPSLHISRGLLTTTATSLDEKRVHGVALTEPVLLRGVHGAKLTAIATGSDKHPLLTPPAPRADAVRLAQDVSGDSAELNATLRPHGRAARRRRWTRAGIPALVLVAAAAVGTALAPGWWPLLLAALIVAAGLVTLGETRYRHLGTSTSGSSVVFAPPTLARERRVLHRDGVIGAASKQTFFQRRAGVTTVTVATAAGAERYDAVDLADADAAALVADLLGDIGL